jgi:hypothetical protein
VLTGAGCKVCINKHKCTVWYDNEIILEGEKDSTTDLWTLPIGLPCPASSIEPLPAYLSNISHAHCATSQIAFFTHTVRNKANSICFAHQALCSPRISTLIKAIRRSFLKGCPNLTAKGVAKYLNPSPASAKRHMKCSQQAIQSTHRKNAIPLSETHTLANIDNEIEHKNFDYGLEQQLLPHTGANVITNDDSPMDANFFCFAVFADKNTGLIYNTLPDCSHLCPLKETYASLLYITTKQTPFWHYP